MGVVIRREGPHHGICVHALQGADDGAAAQVAAIDVRDTAQAHIAEALHEDQVPIRFSMQQIWGDLASL